MGSSHPVCPSSGTSWWAILGPVAFPPLAITLPQRGLSCPSPGSLPGLRWGRDLPGPEQPLFSGLEESWCGPGGTSSGRRCQGNAGGLREWALTVSPAQSWGRRGLTLSWVPPPCRPPEGCLGLGGDWGPAGQRGWGLTLSQTPSQQGPWAGSLLAMSAVSLPPQHWGLPGQHRAGGLRRKEGPRRGLKREQSRAVGRDGSHTALVPQPLSLPLSPQLWAWPNSVSRPQGGWGLVGQLLPGPRARPQDPPPSHTHTASSGPWVCGGPSLEGERGL